MTKHQKNLKQRLTMATHFPSLSQADDISSEAYMFIQDIQLAIMPIGGRSKQKKFSIKFKGKSPESDKAKKLIRQLAQFESYDDTEMLCDVVDNIVKNLVWDGQAYYEILKHKNNTYLNRFTPKNLRKFFKWYIQIIPFTDRNTWKRKFSIINKKKVWKLEIPKSLGGKKDYQKIMNKIGKYEGFGPDFATKKMKSGEFENSYDFLNYRKNYKIYINSTTKSWGWNRRDWSQDNCTEFYTFYRMLNFKYAQALLRESIIDEINCLLKRLSIDCEIVIKGIPSSKKILKLRKKMELGQISFNELSDKVQT